MTKISLEVTPELVNALLTAKYALSYLIDSGCYTPSGVAAMRQSLEHVDVLRLGLMAAEIHARRTPRASS